LCYAIPRVTLTLEKFILAADKKTGAASVPPRGILRRAELEEIAPLGIYAHSSRATAPHQAKKKLIPLPGLEIALNH